MDNKDIRWEQRFSNYKKAMVKLRDVVDTRTYKSLTELEKEGLIQRFEYTFELAWNTLQDLFEHKGYLDIKGPNPVLAQALKDGYIENEKQWRDMRNSRNLAAHTYNSATADEIAENIVVHYYDLLHKLEQRLEEERGGRQKSIFE
jgi:nucleotidyltransferase substrate binding protein (TIGR01987 family)